MTKRFLAVTVLWFLLLFFLYIRRIKEAFTSTTDDMPSSWKGEDLSLVNQGQQPWMHYPIHHSNISDPIIKYKNAYYYELPNEEYEQGLKKTFTLKVCDLLTQALQSQKWSRLTSPNAVDVNWSGVYETWMIELKKKINASPDLKLPGDPKEIQVVHDRWMDAYAHTTDENLLRMDMEVILYRFGKPHGKHVSMSIIARKTNPAKVLDYPNEYEYTVAAIEILGVVPEDQIALFPVIASNPFDPPEMSYSEDMTSFENKIVPNASEVLQEIRRRMDQNVATAQTQMKLGENS